MIKATINNGAVNMTVEGTHLQLMGETCVFIETLFNELSRCSPDEEETKRIMWDMFLSASKSMHP